MSSAATTSLQAYEDDPDAALAKLHAAALAEGLPPDTLFALAELSFLRAESTGQQGQYAASVVYAYALLFPEDERAPLDPLDPRERIAADLYNRALTLAFKRTEKGTLALSGSGEVELPFGRISVARSPDMLKMNGIELYDLQPVAEIEVRGPPQPVPAPGHRRAARREDPSAPGRGAGGPGRPCGARAGDRGAASSIPRSRASTRESSALGWSCSRAWTPRTIAIDGRTTPLEAEPTAALAASLAESQFWKTGAAGLPGPRARRPKGELARRAAPLQARPHPGGARARHGLEPRALGQHGQRPARRSTAPRAGTPSGSSRTTREIQSCTRATSFARRSRRRSIAPTRAAWIRAYATWS